MKTVTITIPEDLDAEAAAEAKRRGISKSELIRIGLHAVLPASNVRVEFDGDPWRALAGFADSDATAEPGDIDEVVYGG